uniref:NADH-ubiquinone oxidoreductase chain 1 n=1 Tax=Gigantolina magna TaxID=99403 RepID=R4I2B3_9CEST|nr:NADH dehydrogenase subunit 1 [Gigantolina magna]
MWFNKLVLSLLFIAFFILGERKILGYSQLRKGPNKVGLLGLFQSFSDLGKLVTKFGLYKFISRSVYGSLGVNLLILLVIMYLGLLGGFYSHLYVSNFFLIYLCITSLISYCVLLVGWGCYSKYSFLAALRVSFGSISFEACFMCIVLFCGLCYFDYGVGGYGDFSIIEFFYCPLLYFCFVISILCETSRTPFDYAESESDLVSGFNLKYMGIYFTCLFACEYVIIFVFCWWSSLLFFNSISGLSLGFHSLLVMWARATLPRVRYDYFVEFFWQVVLLVFILSVFILF